MGESGVVGEGVAAGEEAGLVVRARSDPEAFGRLYEAHYEAILNYLYRRTMSVSAAEELTSNTFFKALRGMEGFRPRVGIRFRSWLYRIATNEARMYWRGRKGRMTASLADEGLRVRVSWPEMESPEVAGEKRRRYEAVHRGLGQLAEKYRVVLMLRYFEGLGIEEIAEILGRRPGTVKSLVHRGLARLAKVMPDATE